MKKILALLLLSLSIVLISCRDDDQNIEILKLPKSISSVYDDITFLYNNVGQLQQVTQKNDDDESTRTIFTYDASGRLQKYVTILTDENGVATTSYTIEYPSMKEARIIDDKGDVVYVDFDEKGNATKVVNNEDSTLFAYDSKGNIVKAEDKSSTTTISYNDGKGILSGIKSPKWILLLTDYTLFTYAVNNPTSVNYIYNLEDKTTTSSEKYTYPKEHIIDGYPTKMSVDYSFENSNYNEVYTIKY